MKRLCLVALVAFWPLVRGPVDPVGAYCILEQVVLDPTDAPRQIQMWGAFAWSDAAGGYAAPVRGYVSYSCPDGRLPACRNEWADLQWIGGTGKAIGYGRRDKPMGRLRRDGDPAGVPDVYPLDGGVVKVESKDPAFTDLVARLKGALGGGLTSPPGLWSRP
jgi:hypothetical protein